MPIYRPKVSDSDLRNPKTDRGKHKGRIVNVPLDGSIGQSVRRGFGGRNEFTLSKPGDTK